MRHDEHMELEEKFDWLGRAAQGDVACSTCAVNPRATLVTHRAIRLLGSDDLGRAREATAHYSPTGRDLSPWLTTVIRSDGSALPVVKTIVVQSALGQYN